jgi:hypothetical protein
MDAGGWRLEARG